MANVGFLRGLQEKIDTLLVKPENIIEGAFYLTTDTNRLYIGKTTTIDGQETNIVEPVNAGIITVDNIKDLPNVSGLTDTQKNNLAGNYYYISSENILCVYNGADWIQINSPVVNTNFKVSNQTSGGFNFTITQSDTNAIETTFNPQIKINSNSTPISFVDGVAELDLYTKNETQNLFKSFNAMEYRGVLEKDTTTDNVVLPTDNIKIGYAYLLNSPYTTTSNIVYPVGTLVVATAAEGKQENDEGYLNAKDIEWTFITGNSTDTQFYFSAIDKGINLVSSAGASEVVGKLVFTNNENSNNEDILLNSTGVADGLNQTIDISHQDYTTEPTEKGDLAGESIPVITSITTSNGHITGYNTGNYIPTKYNIGGNAALSLSADNKVATFSNKIILKEGTTTEYDTTLTNKIASETLALSSDNNQLNINLVWGSF